MIRFPLFGVDSATGNCLCPAGKDCGKNTGKHPKISGWVHLTESKDPGTSDNVGVRTGRTSGIFVLDLDRKNGKDGLASVAALGETLPDTLTVETPSGDGGFHLYFLNPEGLEVKSRQGIWPGVDVRGEGGYVVGPGSRLNGKLYKIIRDVQISEAPEWLLRKLAAPPIVTTPVVPVVEVDPTTPEGVQRVEYARKYLRGVAPLSIEGQEGSRAAWEVSLVLMRRCELPLEVAEDLWHTHYTPRLLAAGTTPWSGQELRHKLVDARDKGEWTPGLAPPGFMAPKPENVDACWRINRKRPDPSHRYTYTIGSVPMGKSQKATSAMVANVLQNHEDWAGVFQYDEFRHKVIAVDPPMPLDAENKGFTKADSTKVGLWLETEGGRLAGRETIRDAIVATALANKFHPVREYLSELPPWDGVDRLSDLAGRLTGDKTSIVQKFLRLTLIGSVRRIFEPGAKMDTILVFYSKKQGVFKTSLVGALWGEDYTRNQMPSLSQGGGKEASGAVKGYWAIEFGELDKLLREDESTVKDFLSRRYDDYRPPYQEEDLRFPRVVTFIGTTNEPDFLKDKSGNRRYWPISMADGFLIDVQWVRTVRDQLWAEAVYLYRQGVKHWLDTDEDRDAQEESAEKHLREDAFADTWDDRVREYLLGKETVRNAAEVWENAIARGDPSAITKGDGKVQRRIATILRRLGCEYTRRRLGGGFREYVYLIPEHLAKAGPAPSEAARAAATALLELARPN